MVYFELSKKQKFIKLPFILNRKKKHNYIKLKLNEVKHIKKFETFVIMKETHENR